MRSAIAVLLAGGAFYAAVNYFNTKHKLDEDGVQPPEIPPTLPDESRVEIDALILEMNQIHSEMIVLSDTMTDSERAEALSANMAILTRLSVISDRIDEIIGG